MRITVLIQALDFRGNRYKMYIFANKLDLKKKVFETS